MTKKLKNVGQESNVCNISDVLEKFGKYQIIQFVLLCLPALFTNMLNINYIFIAGDLNYRCRIPECEGSNTTFEVSWWPNASIDRCLKPVLRAGLADPCTNESFTEVFEECKEWVYETNDTVVAELNLGCRPWLVNLIGTVHSSGMLVSMIIFGGLSDRFGRKPTLIFSVVCGFIGQLKTFATSYYMFLVIEFIEAAATGGSFSLVMLLMMEICGKQNRLMAGVVFAYAIYLGECLFAVIAMFLPYWKTLIHIINGPSILFISYIFLIRESPRWQILNSKTEKAKETILIIADMNKININREELSELDEVQLKNKFNIGADEKREGLKAILTSKEIVKRVLVAAVCRFTASFIYYGMMINSVFLPGDKYINFLLQTVMSFPGELISLYLMNKIGRKMPLVVGFLICGVLCVITGYVPATYTWVKILLFLLGKMLISVCFTGAITYIMELFPTSARGCLLGFGSFASRVGGMLAPLTPVLNPISEALPSILFGCSALITSILLNLTPETKDLPLMDTIRQVEESALNAKELKKKVPTVASDYLADSSVTTRMLTTDI